MNDITKQKVANTAVRALGYTALAAGVVIGTVAGFRWMTK